MAETLATLVADSFQIAWDYLEATDELGRPDIAANHLLDTIEAMIRCGERRRLRHQAQPQSRPPERAARRVVVG